MTVKQKKRICTVLGATLLFTMLVVVGGLEQGWMPFVRGAILAGVSEVIGIALLWKAGVLKP